MLVSILLAIMTKYFLLSLTIFTLGFTSAFSQTSNEDAASSETETVESKEEVQEPVVEITLSPPPEDPKKQEPAAEDGGTKQWVIISICIVLYVSLRIMIRRKS